MVCSLSFFLSPTHAHSLTHLFTLWYSHTPFSASLSSCNRRKSTVHTKSSPYKVLSLHTHTHTHTHTTASFFPFPLLLSLLSLFLFPSPSLDEHQTFNTVCRTTSTASEIINRPSLNSPGQNMFLWNSQRRKFHRTGVWNGLALIVNSR